MTLFDIIFIICILIIFGILLLFFLNPKKKLKLEVCKKWQKKIEFTNKLAPSYSLLESHKIFVQALSELTNVKQAAKIIKKFENRFTNKKKIWFYHRMRNKIAHEVDMQIISKDAKIARQEFCKALSSLC